MAENWNRPHDGGVIDPANFSPYPKNPVIAKFFKEIGRVDELGSGVRNTFKYCGIYTPGTKPEFIEEDVFRTIIPRKQKKVKKLFQPPIGMRFGEKFGESSGKSSEENWRVKRITEELRKKYGRNAEEIRKKCGRNRSVDAFGTRNYNGRNCTENR